MCPLWAGSHQEAPVVAKPNFKSHSYDLYSWHIILIQARSLLALQQFEHNDSV